MNGHHLDWPNMGIKQRSLSHHTFYGAHETQVSEGSEADLHKHLTGCRKNPGHKKFVAAKDFEIHNLPEDCRDDELVTFIKATADLTVRVAVTMTSTNRPCCWPDTDIPYAFYTLRGSDVMRIGTAFVYRVLISEPGYNDCCGCHKCQHSETPSKMWGTVHIYTATHVIFDDLEAKYTTCRLFYDRQDSPLVTLDGFKADYSSVEKDMSFLSCVTCDIDLLDKLFKMWSNWGNLWSKISKKFSRKPNIKINFIVSHPHGCPKQVSIGRWVDKLMVEDCQSVKLTKYTYTTSTCPGSSGALVRMLRDTIHVHSGVNGEGTNFSSLGGEWDNYL